MDNIPSRFDVQIINKPIDSMTKQDLLKNISGKFGLLFSAPAVVDEDVIIAAGKFILILLSLLKYWKDHLDKYNIVYILHGFSK